MDGNEIFKEILKSKELKDLLGVSDSESIKDDDILLKRNEVTIIKNIIEGQINHTSDDALFKNVKKLYDL